MNKANLVPRAFPWWGRRASPPPGKSPGNEVGIKQLCNRKVRDFAMALRARKVSGASEKRAPGRGHCACAAWARHLRDGPLEK